MAARSEEKLICDKFNLEALTVNQVKSFKALADGKDVFIETKTGSGILYILLWFKCVLTALHVNCMILFDKDL
jgi:hypothetical protein